MTRLDHHPLGPSLPLRRHAPAPRRAWLAAASALVVGSLGLTVAPPDPAGASAVARQPVCAKPYTIVAGDYWYGIAKRVNVSLTSLLEMNAATATTPIFPGSTICLPDFASDPGTTTTSTIAGTTTTSPAGGTVMPMAAFPIQGPCWYADSWHAPRSGGRLHEGVDLIAKQGQYVYAVVDGTLTKQALNATLSGNAWWLTGADGTYYFYAHMSAFAPGLKVGSKVAAGQVIGFVGSTGNAAGAHMHFEVHPKGGGAINPTATVRAVDGCKKTDPYPQPGGAAPPAPGVTTAPAAPSAPAAPPTTATAAKAAGRLWSFISPATAYDTAWTGSRVAAGSTTRISVAKLPGVVASTDAVMVRLTTRGAARDGYLVVHPCDTPAPLVASLTYPARGSVVGSTVAEVVSSQICLTTNQSLAIRVEVIAFHAATGVGLKAIRSARALDTRETKRLAPGMTVAIDPAKLSADAGTQAISATITVVDPAAAGTLFVGFCGSGPWGVATTADALQSFSIAMRVTRTGWCVSSSVATDVVVDVTGVWTGQAGAPAPTDPVRVYDSRLAGQQVGTSPVWVQVAGHGGIPAGATVAMVSISTVTGGNPGIVFVVPCGTERSQGAAAVGAPQRIVTAVVPVTLGAGAVCISALRPVDVIVDVVGYA